MSRQVGSAERGQAMREQIELIALVEGFFTSSVIFTLHRLKVFERLEDGEQTAEEIAEALGGDKGSLERLLNAGVMLKLLKRQGDVYQLSQIARNVLVPSAGESYIGDWIELMEQFRDAYSRLDQAVLTGSPSMDPRDYLGGDQARTRKYVMAMHSYAATRGKDLARYLDTSRVRSLLDLGCGPGTFAFHLAACNPSMRVVLADVPGVLEVAKEVQHKYELPNPIDYLSMDASRDPIEGKYDMVLASNFLQCFDESQRRELLQRIYDAIEPGGSLVVQAQHLQSDRLGGRWAVFVDLNLLCTTERGRNHTMEETVGWLQETGFVNMEINTMSVFGTTSFVRGYRPHESPNA